LFGTGVFLFVYKNKKKEKLIMEKDSRDKIDTLFEAKAKGDIYSKVIEETEKVLIDKALKCSFGNQSIAAKLLGINRNTLRMKIKKMEISVDKFKI
jgi:DNA-binding protein Fis